jgi:hypothetical protein
LRELITKINTKTMNIQDKMQEIHHKYGVTEKANYEIQLFIEDLIIKDRAEQLTLTDVMRSDCEIEEIVEQNKDYVLGFYTGNELKEYLSNNYA